MEKITEKQAVVVAKFLEGELMHHQTHNSTHLLGDHPVPYWDMDDGGTFVMPESLINWLYYSEGQEALMDRLEDTHGMYWRADTGRLKLLEYKTGDGFITYAKTRQHALLLAILEMIKEMQEVFINQDNRSPQEIEDAFRHAKNIVEKIGWRRR